MPWPDTPALRAAGTIREKAQGLRLLLLCVVASWLLLAAPFVFAQGACSYDLVGSSDGGGGSGRVHSSMEDLCAELSGAWGGSCYYAPDGSSVTVYNSSLSAPGGFTPGAFWWHTWGAQSACDDPEPGGDEDWAIQVADAVTVAWAVVLLWLTAAGAVWLSRMVR